jgi:hypothetical protein
MLGARGYSAMQPAAHAHVAALRRLLKVLLLPFPIVLCSDVALRAVRAAGP